jgi:hypothetical protein
VVRRHLADIGGGVRQIVGARHSVVHAATRRPWMPTSSIAAIPSDANVALRLHLGHVGTVALIHPYRDKDKHRTNLLSERIGTWFRYGNWPLKDWLKE